MGNLGFRMGGWATMKWVITIKILLSKISQVLMIEPINYDLNRKTAKSAAKSNIPLLMVLYIITKKKITYSCYITVYQRTLKWQRNTRSEFHEGLGSEWDKFRHNPQIYSKWLYFTGLHQNYIHIPNCKYPFLSVKSFWRLFSISFLFQ